MVNAATMLSRKSHNADQISHVDWAYMYAKWHASDRSTLSLGLLPQEL